MSNIPEPIAAAVADTPERVAALLAYDEAAGPATDADVRGAEQEAAEAANLVGALEERVRDGDESVTPDEIEDQRALGRFARLRAEATRRRAEKAARAARLRACDALRAEIEGYAADSGKRFVELLAAAEEAVTAFVVAVEERNTSLEGWRRRMWSLQVPEHRNPLVPPAEHAHLGHHGQDVIAGRRRLNRLDSGQWVTVMLQKAVRNARAQDIRLRIGNGDAVIAAPNVDHPEPYANLTRVDAPTVDPDPNLRHFLTVGGGVITMDHEPSQAERQGIVREISRKEAWGE